MKKETEVKIAVIETEIKNINDSIKQHCLTQRNDFDKVFTKLDKIHNRFAGKWVEKVSIGVLISIIAAIIIFTVTGGI